MNYKVYDIKGKDGLTVGSLYIDNGNPIEGYENTKSDVAFVNCTRAHLVIPGYELVEPNLLEQK